MPQVVIMKRNLSDLTLIGTRKIVLDYRKGLETVSDYKGILITELFHCSRLLESCRISGVSSSSTIKSKGST